MSTYHQQFMRITQQKVADIRRRGEAKYSTKGNRLLQPARPMEFTLEQFRVWTLDHFQGREDGAGKCEYCKCWLTVATFIPDHMTALARGGRNSLDNLAVCCASCNDEKGEMSAEWYRFFRRCLEQMPVAEAAMIRERLKKSEKAASTVRFLRGRLAVNQQTPAAALAATAGK